MATFITLMQTTTEGTQDSLIGSLNAFVKELNEGQTSDPFEWHHIQDVDGGFRFMLMRAGRQIGQGVVRSDFIRPGA